MREPINSSTFMIDRSWTSSIDVTFIWNLRGRYLKIFRTSFSSVIGIPRVYDSLAMSRTQTLNSAIVYSSAIFRALYWVVMSWNLEFRTLAVPSCATARISHAFLALVQVLIILKIFLSTPLKIALRARELPNAASSSVRLQSFSGLRPVYASYCQQWQGLPNPESQLSKSWNPVKQGRQDVVHNVESMCPTTCFNTNNE